MIDAGNVNAVERGGRHYLTYYSGTRSQATVYVAAVCAFARDRNADVARLLWSDAKP